jgi:transcriptional regulator with XRE-family HTH domain
MINSTQQKTTGQLVKAHREGANMSLSELSETTGISRSTLNAWETGANAVHRTWPRHRDNIKWIALAIGVSESLLWGDEPEPANPVASFAGPIPVAEGEYSGIFVDRGHAAGETMAVSAAVSVHIDECYRVVGSSMSIRIRHGDIIGVKAASTPAHGVLHVVCQDGLVGIYETARKSGAWTL